MCHCAGLQLEHQQLRSLNPAQDGALIYRADMQSTLHEVVLYGFLQPNAAGYMHVSPCRGGHVWIRLCVYVSMSTLYRHISKSYRRHNLGTI